MKTRVHVNTHVIKANLKHNRVDPPISVSTYKGTTPCHNAKILCPHCNGEAAEVIYSPRKPLSCGARVYIETKGNVTPVQQEYTPEEDQYTMKLFEQETEENKPS